MSGQSNGQPLGISQPVTPSPSTGRTASTAGDNAESDTGNNYIPPSSRSPPLNDDAGSFQDKGFKGAVDQDHGVRRGLTNRGQRQRNSGGFLLQPSCAPISSPNQAIHSTQDASEKLRGKRKVESGDLQIPKRRTVHQRYQSKPAVGSSPLSIELYNTAPARAEGNEDGFDQQGAASDPLRYNIDSYTRLDNHKNQSRHETDQSESNKGTFNVLGHDTDPAQIVNLALNLSESRRRTFSAGRSSSLNPLGNRLLPSSNQNPGSFNVTTQAASEGSLRQYLERRVSTNISPRSSKRRDRERENHIPSSARRIHSQAQAPSPNFDAVTAEEAIFNASDATLIRAEKAKVALELNYEYRRLLQYLPAIPRPGQCKSALGQSTITSTAGTVQELGRLYNPLQYIRNRKVRGRQRRTLDAEADGWKDLVRVRKWVDIVAGEREAGMRTSDNPYPVPPFEIGQTDPTSENLLLEPVATNTEHGANKPRRKLDWSITPWDLLADAYWLHQDNNIEVILNPHGRKIISDKSITKEVPTRRSQESSRSPIRRSKSIPRQFLTPEKLNLLTPHSRNGSIERGRHQHRRHEPSLSKSNDNISRDRRHRWPRGLMRSRSSSSSNESIEGKVPGNYRDSGFFVARDHTDSAPLEKQMRDLLQKEAEIEALDSAEKAEKAEQSITETASSNSTGREFPNGVPSNLGIVQTKALQGLQPFGSTSRHVRQSASRDEKGNEQTRHSPKKLLSNIYTDSIKHILEPSKLTEPTIISRPASLKEPVPSRLKQNQNEEIAKGDNSQVHLKEAANPAEQETGSFKDQDMRYKERLSNFGSGLLTPLSAESFGRKVKRADWVSTRGIKDADSDSKLRGFFKGGRIAELVGNEVQKVGDRIWKKESHNDLSRVPSNNVNYDPEESDIETDMDGLASSPEDHLSRTSTHNDESTISLQNSTAVDPSKQYTRHVHNLRFPLSKDEQSSVTPRFFLGDDHITRQQAAQRARGRSTRFDRLAPSRIDIEGISPTSSPPMSRIHTRDTTTSHDGSRRSSDSQSDARDRKFDKGLGIPGTAGTGGPPVSLLSSLDSRQHRSREGLNAQGERQWSVSDRGVSAVRGTVTKRETARVRALLLSSGVKANEITRCAQEPRPVPSRILQDLQKTSNRPLPKVPRSQEHILAARMLISNIETSNRQLRDAAVQFSSGTVDNLHEQIRAMEEHVTYKLTASVRAAADDADAFSIELTTTYTLAVKQLHDSVDDLLRRRRRRFRWIRRGGYVLLEWTLLGIMWWVWLIVVLIRLIRGTIGGLIRGVRWLFWM